MKHKELVTLRTRPLKNGCSSLFLDYTIDGVRHKELLKMYIIPESGKVARLQNIETLKAAEAMKAKRTIDIQRGWAGLPSYSDKSITLYDYLNQRISYYISNGKVGYANIVSGLTNWIKDWNDKITVRKVSKDDILSFVEYMRDESSLGDGTIYNYFQTLGTQFKAARRDGLIQSNPFEEIAPQDKPRKPEEEREYLTMEELRLLMNTPIDDENVRSLFMFSCFTGLRYSDVSSLTWKQIRHTASGYQIEIRQIKTKRMVYIPLSDNAASFLPEQKKSGFIFPTRSIPRLERILDDWVKAAGIDKHITFHCARHTCATLLLTSGVDIYTVSKLLGHTDIKTTQIYAKVIDEKKVLAVNAIPKL